MPCPVCGEREQIREEKFPVSDVDPSLEVFGYLILCKKCGYSSNCACSIKKNSSKTPISTKS
ncbi:hypothetical protein [Nitrosopumilus sp.]|uniref:hypothetical protein n=1 Tax=Nitrosopumilus sp. TaxID=2024843 RepID=UPI003D0A72D9